MICINEITKRLPLKDIGPVAYGHKYKLIISNNFPITFVYIMSF